MPRPEFADMLEMSNQQLIDNLNSRRYAPQGTQLPLSNPLFQNIMGNSFRPGAGYFDPYAGLETMAAQGAAAQAYGEAMARRARSEAVHAGIKTAMMAIPYVGFPLSFAYDPLANWLGLRSPEEVYTQEDYVKGMMAESLYGATLGQMGPAFLGNRLSQEQAQSVTDDIYGFMRRRGFQGLELSRIAPMLGESGLLTPAGNFADTEEALNQFTHKLEAFLEKISTTVKATSMDIEQATAMTISQSILAGQRGPVAGMDYLESAQTMANLTGMSVGDADMAMRASLGAWGSTVFDRTALAGASAYNVAAASVAANAGGAYDAAWMGVGDEKFGLRMAGWGNQYWMKHQRTLARLYAAGAVPGTDAWNTMISGGGLPDSVGSYKEIGDINDRLEAQYFGLQMAAENPNMMTTAAMGMTVEEMVDKGITSREAQTMYMMQHGWRMNEAQAFLSMYDQTRTQRGRSEVYYGTMASDLQANLGRTAAAMSDAFAMVTQLSSEKSPLLGDLLGSAVGLAYLNDKDVLPLVRQIEANSTLADLLGGFDPGVYMAMPEDVPGWAKRPGRVNANYAYQAVSSILARELGLGDVTSINLFGNRLALGGASEAAMEVMFGGAVDADMIRMLEGARINRPGRDIDVLAAVDRRAKSRYGVSGGDITDQMRIDIINEMGGVGNIPISDGMTFEDVLKGRIGKTSVFFDQASYERYMPGRVQQYLDNLYQNQQALGELMSYRFAGSDAQINAMNLAAQGGYLKEVGMGESFDNFHSLGVQMDAMMYLGKVPESLQGYQYDNAHSAAFSKFITRMNDQGFAFTDATQGLSHTSAEGQMALRNNISQAGFNKSYGQLSQVERNYVEEYIHLNDISGTAGSRNWAGRHDELERSARLNALSAVGDISFGTTARTEAHLAAASQTFNVRESQVEAYAQWAVAREQGASAEELASLKARIGDNFYDVERAFYAYEGTAGRNATGQLLARAPLAAIQSVSGISEEAARRLWNTYRSGGAISEVQDIISGLGDEYTNVKTWGDFYKATGQEVPTWATYDAQSDRIANISEFKGATLATVAPSAGAIWPVAIVSGGLLGSRSAEEIWRGNESVARGDGDETGSVAAGT